MDEEKQRKAELEKWNHTKNLLQMNYQPSVEEFKNTHSQILKDIKIKNEQSKHLKRKIKKMDSQNMFDDNDIFGRYFYEIESEFKKEYDRCWNEWSKSPGLISGSFSFYPQKKRNEYSFRGNLNIQKVILDTIKDQKIGFIAISRDTFIFGITNCYSDFLPFSFSFLFPFSFNEIKYGFLISTNLPKKHISDVIKFLNEYKKQVEKLPHEITKEIRKDNREYDKNGMKRETVIVKVF